MGHSERSYRLTQAGEEAWEGEDVAIPSDYRRLLWLITFHGHAGVIQGLLPHYARRRARRAGSRYVAELWLDLAVCP